MTRCPIGMHYTKLDTLSECERYLNSYWACHSLSHLPIGWSSVIFHTTKKFAGPDALIWLCTLVFFHYKLINCSAPRLGKQVCLLRNKSKLCALTNGESGCRENNVQHPPTSKAVFPKLYTYIEITKCCYYDGSLSHTSPETLASVWQCDMGAGKKCRILDYFRSDVQNLYFNFSDFMPRNNWRCYSKPSSCQRTSSINIIWKLIKYINSQTPSQIYWFTFSGTGIQ